MRNLLTILIAVSALIAQAQRLDRNQRKQLERLKADIAFLSSDDLRGRGTGSEGEKQSAKYIAKKLEEAGVEAKGTDGFYQTFKIVTLRTAVSGNLKIGETQYPLYKGFFPLSPSVDAASVQADAVVVGYGIREEGKRMDYSKKDVMGKVALIHIGSPDGIHPHSGYLKWHGVEYRVDEAKRMGAIGVVFYGGNEAPDGELRKTQKNSGIPVVYVNEFVPDTSISEYNTNLNLKILTEVEAGYNVVGFQNNGASSTVVIGAHHDHLGTGEIQGSLEEKAGFIHNGADDNASGVALMLELARIIRAEPKAYANRNYLFIAFSGEEMGLIGSKYFVKNPTIDLNTIDFMINMDMVGMLNEESKTLVINGVGTSPDFTEVIEGMEGLVEGIDNVKTTKSGIGASDHTAFYLADIPAVHFFTGQHKHYHRSTDDIENLNLPGEVFVTEYIATFLKKLDGSGDVEFTKTVEEDKQGRMKFTVTLGVMPDYVFSGEGMRVDGVKEGRVGSKAGMVKGDVIVNMNGTSVKNIQDYMKVLSQLKKGDETIIVVNRDGEMIELKAVFE